MVAVEGRPCFTFNSDMKVRVNATGLYTYPDVSVVCGEVRYTDGQRGMMENPVVIVEVLSPTTEAYDRGEKFVHYQGLPSLTDYLIISQETMRVEQYVRQTDDHMCVRPTTNGCCPCTPARRRRSRSPPSAVICIWRRFMRGWKSARKEPPRRSASWTRAIAYR